MDINIIREIDLSNPTSVLQIMEVQVPSYMVEAELIGFYEIPPLKDTPASISSCGESFYGCYVNDKLAGFISCVLEEDMLDIYRMAIHPDYFRRGIAGKLIEYIESLYSQVSRVIVSTGSKNLPAKQLYLKNGFKIVGEKEVATGVYITLLEKLKQLEG